MTSPHQGGRRAARGEAPRRRAVEELLRPRPGVAGCTPARSSRRSTWIEEPLRQEPHGRATPTWPPSRPATPSARRPSCSTTPTRSSPATLAPGHLHQHHRQHRAGLGPHRRRPAGRAAAVPRLATRSRRRRTSSTSCRSTRTSACAPCRPRTRSPASAPPSAPPSAATSASPPPAARASPSRPRRWAWPSASSCRCSSSTSSAAVRPPACPPRPSRPTCCMADVRPPRRVAAADRRRLQPVALLRGRHRGGPHRAQVPHAGDPAVRRLPGQRRRAVAPARRRRPARHLRRRSPPSPTTPTPTATRSSGPTSATPRPWPGRGPSPARPASMHRIGGIEKEDGTGNITYDPANHERMVHLRAGQGRRHRQRHPAGRGRRRRDDAELLVLGWGSTWGAIGGAVDRVPGRGPARWPTPTSSTSTRSPPNLGEVLRRYPQVLVPEMNLGQLVAAGAGRVPRRRPVGHQGAGRARSPPASSKPPSSTTWEA